MTRNAPRPQLHSLALTLFLMPTLWQTVSPAVSAVPYKLETIQGIGDLNAPPAARELLGRNGFVVIPRYYHQIFSPYVHEKLPPFVTVDSLHRTFHIIFEEQIRRLETSFSTEVEDITATMMAALSKDTTNNSPARGHPDAARLARGYFAVAHHLLKGTTPDRSVDSDIVDEVKLIRAAAGRSPSPLFGYSVDYSQFKPRGFYAETETLRCFFQAMTWYGDMPFRLASEKETRAALLIADIFLNDSGIHDKWSHIDQVYTHLIAPQDDLSPLEYAQALRVSLKPAARETFEEFQRQAAAFRDPKINSMVIPPRDAAQWKDLSKGMRFFGKRHLPDSEAFMSLTSPAVASRPFPSGLDIMAADGSDRAASLLRASGDFGLRGYGAGQAKARQIFSEFKDSRQASHYSNVLGLLETLWSPPHSKAPEFMKTPAYQDKNLLTALSIWASTRHTWQLQAKQSVVYLNGGKSIPGYVEPNLKFLESLTKLTDRTIEILRDVKGIEIDRLAQFRELVMTLRTIAEKQLAGETLTGNETRVLEGYGPKIAHLSYFERHAYLSDNNLPWMSLVADIHTEHLAGKALQVATGGAVPIFVIVPFNGKPHLMVGGVYSYFEFLQPYNERLTDQEWRNRWDRGELPPVPTWALSFSPIRDVEELIKNLSEGQIDEGVRYTTDPRIPQILRRELASGRWYGRGAARPEAINLYALKAGHEAIPFLIDLIDGAKDDDRTSAATALAGILSPADIPSIQGKILQANPQAASAYLRVLASANATDALLQVFREAKTPFLKEMTASVIGATQERAATPALVAAFREADKSLRSHILEALIRIWAVPRDRGKPPSEEPPPLSSEELQWREGVEKIVLATLRSGDTWERQPAIRAVSALRLTKAMPELERLAADPSSAQSIVSTLGELKTPEAARTLAKMLDLKFSDPAEYGHIIAAMPEGPIPEAIPGLTRLLDDKRPTRYNDLRVCDWATTGLSRLIPEGPGFWSSREKKDHSLDLVVEVWRSFLQIRDHGGLEKAPPELASGMAGRLFDLIKMREGADWSWDPIQSLQWLRQAEECVRHAPPSARRSFTQRAATIRQLLTATEIKYIVRLLGYYQRDHGQYPPEKPNPWQTIRESTYRRAESSRYDSEGRLLDLWGKPYVYYHPPRRSTSPVEIYSFGPNGRDENGLGDDIASWKVAKP